VSNVAALPADRCLSEPTAPTVQALPALHTDLGGLPIRRLLPRSQRRMVGPWCFCDLYGPLAAAMDVPPHPHTGLQTVSWLLEGAVRHDDSLGATALARPGRLNLMTAGRGIAHAERTPPGAAARLHGVQLWIALPDAHRHLAPAFEAHEAVPEAAFEGGSARVIIGALAGVSSPARAFSPVVGAELALRGGRAELPLDRGFEHALLVLSGGAALDGRHLEADTLYYLGAGRATLCLEAEGAGARLLLLGGAPFREPVLMWWNFVARTGEELRGARADWEAGRRFGTVAADAGRRLAAPPFVARPVPRS
jgi:hypothetical protein